jgi:hypothetical protein
VFANEAKAGAILYSGQAIITDCLFPEGSITTHGDNVVLNGSVFDGQSVDVYGDKSLITGCQFVGSSANAEIRGDGCSVIGNEFSSCTTAITVNATADDTKINGNSFNGCTTNVSDSGTNTSIQTQEDGDSTFIGGEFVVDATSDTSAGAYYRSNADRPSGGQYTGGMNFYNNGATPIASILAMRSSSDTTGHIIVRTSNSQVFSFMSDGAARNENVFHIKERAAKMTDYAGYGQLWVKNTTPCELWFTDDAGTDKKIV